MKAVLAVNAGSSSVKLALFDASGGDDPLATARAERIGSPQATCKLADAAGAPLDGPALPAGAGASHASMLGWLLPELLARAGCEVAAVGHRIVHGGADFSAPARIDADVIARLERLVPLARTHQPHGLAAIRAVGALIPEAPQVACFDTAFHATIPEVARTIALPDRVRAAGVRRYGFHGLSYQWIAARLPDVLGATAQGRVIVAHLGNGASLCGMLAGESRATTMGFTPLDGLVMGERPGLVDPGAILFMIEEMGMEIDALRRALFRESGLLGVSGLSNDMRTLLASDTPQARLAVDLYVHRAGREIAAMAGEIGGADALVFTAGVGENAAEIRARIVAACGWMGFALDRQANAARAPLVSPPGARKPVAVIPTNEEAVIAAAARAEA